MRDAKELVERFKVALLSSRADEEVAAEWHMSRVTVAFLRALLLSVLQPDRGCGSRAG